VVGYLEKPLLEIAGNENYSIKEMTFLKQELSPVFTVETKMLVELSAAEIGGLLLFTFQGLESGFFQAIGERLWLEISDKMAGLIASKSTKSNSDVEFHITKQKVMFRASSKDREVIKEAIAQFPKALEFFEKEGKSDYYEFNEEKKKWE
jgi:phosphoenolpyruvate synthase/pyruvate phosphate dikinase